MSIFDENNINSIRFRDAFKIDEIYNFDCSPERFTFRKGRDLNSVTNDEFLYYNRRDDNNFLAHSITRKGFNFLIRKCLTEDNCWVNDNPDTMLIDLAKIIRGFLQNNGAEFMDDLVVKTNIAKENYRFISFDKEIYEFPQLNPFEIDSAKKSNKKVLHILIKFDPSKVYYSTKLISIFLS